MKLLSVKTLTVIATFVSLMTVPSAAQQEINPDHFDQKPSPAKHQKTRPAARKTTRANSTQRRAGQSAAVSRNKNEQGASMLTEARTTVR